MIDTAGAGDTCQAALLAWQAVQHKLTFAEVTSMQVEELGALLDFAMRAAAITCSRLSADLPRRAELG